MDLITIIILLGIFQGFFIGILLLTKKKGNKSADKILGLLFFNFSLSISYFIFLRMDLIEDIPLLSRISFPSLFLFGPLFYFYTKYLTDKGFHLKTKHLLHFLPFLLVIMLYFLPFMLLSKEDQIAYLRNYQDNRSNITAGILSLIQLSHIFIYLFIIKKLLKEFNLSLKDSFSSIDKLNLRWLNMGLTFFASIFGFLFACLLLVSFNIDVLIVSRIVTPLAVTFVIYYMGYKGFTQPDIFFYEQPEYSSVKKYERSTLTSEKSSELMGCLLKLMNEDKLFTDNDLSLQKLADKMSVLPHHLSQVINEQLKQNFFDFVNSYRIEEAKRLLLAPEMRNLTVLAIAEESGFNSKTAFNTAFKKNTGQTPTQFRKTSLSLAI